ncbi:MAG: protein kinase, partial [Rubrobacter sp.]|nr:protein kinase [Rubrobacter sp.]
LPAIENGATGYLLKDAPREELFQAIRSAAQGKPLLAPAVAARLMERMRGVTKSPPTGTVTFLFTDIESSTSIWEKYPQQMQAALARHDEILRSNIEANGGYVFKTVGDAYCAAFATARQALEATLVAQGALFAEPWEASTTLRVRMALHTGATEEREGDYFGPPVNRVARLLSAGHGGQILLSAVTYGLVRDNLEPGVELRDLGEHRLKDLRYTERIFQLVAPGLPTDFPPLSTLDTRSDERYSLTKLISSSEMAEVYLAHDQELDRDVVFKVLRNQYSDDEGFVERFKRDVRNVALLSHPNILQIYDRGETEDGGYYIAMERVSGGNLKERILRDGPLPAPVATAIALQVAQALQVAHEHGVIHQNVSPQNVLLTESGEAKVADFGLIVASSTVTTPEKGAILGTTRYLSPEQTLRRSSSPQSDLYSLGVVLYEMLTGELHHDTGTPAGTATEHITSRRLRSPREINPDVPDGINAVTMKLLAQNPKDRYQDTSELIDDLERVHRGESPAFLSGTQQDTSELEQVQQEEDSPAFFLGPQQEAARSAVTSARPPVSLSSPPPHPENAKNWARQRRVLPWVLVALILVGLVAAVALIVVPNM